MQNTFMAQIKLLERHYRTQAATAKALGYGLSGYKDAVKNPHSRIVTVAALAVENLQLKGELADEQPDTDADLTRSQG